MPPRPDQFEARGPAAFIAQVVRYVSSGHIYYKTGVIPEDKDPRAVDAKLRELYEIGRPAWARQRC